MCTSKLISKQTSKPISKVTSKPTFTTPTQFLPSTKADSLTLRRSPRNKVIPLALTTSTSVIPKIQNQAPNILLRSLQWHEKLPIKRQLSFVDNGGHHLRSNEVSKNVEVNKGKGGGRRKTQGKRLARSSNGASKLVVTKKTLAKTREKRKIKRVDNVEQITRAGNVNEEGFDYSDSDDSDINVSDIEWQVGEEDFNDADDLFDDNNRSRLVDNVDQSLRLGRSGSGAETNAHKARIWGVDDLEVDVNAEEEYESDDLRSLKGSDNEAEFESHMKEIKYLSNEAWTYLDVIPAKYWSRHAFGTSKS